MRISSQLYNIKKRIFSQIHFSNLSMIFASYLVQSEHFALDPYNTPQLLQPQPPLLQNTPFNSQLQPDPNFTHAC